MSLISRHLLRLGRSEPSACREAFVTYSDLFEAAVDVNKTALATAAAKKTMDYLLTWYFSLSHKGKSKPQDCLRTLGEGCLDFEVRWERAAGWLSQGASSGSNTLTPATNESRPAVQTTAPESNSTGLEFGVQPQMDKTVRDGIVTPLILPPSEDTPDLEDVIGMNSIKQKFKMKMRGRRRLSRRKDQSQSFMVLLYGIPGTGKSVVVQALAKKYDFTLLNIADGDVLSGLQGGTEKSIKAIFDWAMDHDRIMIFFDECEALFRKRADAGSQNSAHSTNNTIIHCLNKLLHCRKKIIVIGATNLPQVIDKAILRRLATKIFVPCPNVMEREQLLRHYLRDVSHCITDEEIKELASWTYRRTGSDLEQLVEGAIDLSERTVDTINCFEEIIEQDGGRFWQPSDKPDATMTTEEELERKGQDVRCREINQNLILYLLDNMPLAETLTMEAEMQQWAGKVGWEVEKIPSVCVSGEYAAMEKSFRDMELGGP